jgi:adenine-specific DNA-methyltransferase
MTAEPDMVDLSTPELAGEKLAALEELFPGVVADGVLDAARLGELVDLKVAGLKDGRERYGLMWAGKQEAVQSLLRPCRGTLVPDVDNSVNFDTAENVFIEGDNLEVLKLLQKSYNDKVKVIYIDPPYNTGKDFVYDDDFRDGLRGYLEYSGQLDDDGNRRSADADVAGRRHSRWLSMMYPRLVLARNLLTQDGVIFISIDDNEVATLRMVCGEVFGEENFVENYIWESNFRPDNSSSIERENSQHVLCFARNRNQLGRLVGGQKKTEGLPSLTKNSMGVTTLRLNPEWVDLSLPDGAYGPGDQGSGYSLEDRLVIDGGKAQGSFGLSGRLIWSQNYLEDQVADGTRIIIKGTGFVPYSKKSSTAVLPPTSLISRDEVGDVLAGNAELRSLFDKVPFNHPKPTSLIRYLVNAVTHDDKSALILDFFAGSGSTMHAISLLNQVDGGARRTISVNLPEPVPEGSVAAEMGFAVVSDITWARIQAVMGSVDGSREQGLRTLALRRSNFVRHEAESDAANLLALSAGTLVSDEFDMYAVAQEVFLKEGVRLDAPWEWSSADGADVVSADGVAIVLTRDLTDGVVKEVMDSMPRVLVFLEDGFEGNDSVKANAFFACQQAGIIMKTV